MSIYLLDGVGAGFLLLLFGLVGDNGAGKSSLLKVLNGEIVLAEATLQRFGGDLLVGWWGIRIMVSQ